MRKEKIGTLFEWKGGNSMASNENLYTNDNLFISASEVGKLLGVCRSKAYKVIQQLNDELKTQGYIIIQGKTHRAYFLEKIYRKVA